MTTNTTPANGKVRRTLAEQIDRLDQVLDGLAENLNEAVADAVKAATTQAVQQAVHQALAEVLTNPDVLTLLGGAARLHAPPHADGNKVGFVRAWVGKKLQAVREACGVGMSLALWTMSGLVERLQCVWQYRTQVLVGLGVGAAVGVAGYFAGPWVSGVLTGLAGFASALAIQAGTWLRRVLGDFGLNGNG
jgi:hypothetical protein